MGNIKENIEAIIFDMNGVIVDDEFIHELAFGGVIKKFGVNLTHDDYDELCFGKRDKEGFLAIIDKFNIEDADVAGLIKEKAVKYKEIAKEKIRSFPGVIELIKELNDKFVLALSSGAIKSEVEMILDKFGISSYFKVIVSAEDVKEGKPSPEPYIKASGLLGIAPDKCLVIEDSIAGVESAKSAGMKCIAITTNFSREELKSADFVADSFEEIRELLK